MRLLSRSIRHLAFAGALAAGFAGCTDFSTTPDSLGHVTVSVTNQNNVGVQGLVVDLLMQDKLTVWRSIRTGSNGGGEFGAADGGVIAQVYYVRLDPGVDYEIAPPDTNDKPVVVVIGQSYAITFKVRPKQTGGGPPD
jgi:hypothetical protein